ncbi:unnamed protein product [Candida verbasci]|uniref:Vacuolar membrane protein n=1 Tax=Candida verbasci TaxID=1227364 RepID=A0A9W4X8S5_9ASCO|nr:unnamed protein product [Candida verbasci]
MYSMIQLSPITIYKSNVKEGKCELIGSFSLFTQLLLGLLCLSSLVIKRIYFEYPIRRNFKIWCFDVSKQLIGAFGVHIFNITLSTLKTSDDLSNLILEEPDIDDDACDWYFLNIVLDCTIGVYILYLVFKFMNHICKDYFHITNIESGKYGNNLNSPSFKAFFKQLIIYFISLMITKVILYIGVEIFEYQLLWICKNILLYWLNDYSDEFEIFIVMFIIPIIMNCLQLILIDNFIRNQFWKSTNQKIQMQYPNFQNETDSIRQREIDQVINEELINEIENNQKNYHSINQV